MAATVACTAARLGHKILRVWWVWATTSGTTSASGGSTTFPITGEILGIKAEPDGTNKPADNYDVTIVDAINGMDVLNSDAINLPQALTGVGNIRVPVDSQNSRPIYLVDETLSFAGTALNGGAGDSAGTFYIYIREP